MRILAIDVGLTKCGICILNCLNREYNAEQKQNLEIEFWENLNLTRVPYKTQMLKNYYYSHLNSTVTNNVIVIEEDDEEDDIVTTSINTITTNSFYKISNQQLPEHAIVKNSNLLKIGDKIELIYQNLKSFAPLWLLQPESPIDLIIIEDQNSKFSTHLDEYQYIFYMFFKVYCDLNNIAIKIKFQGGFCKNKIQRINTSAIELYLQALLPKKKKKSDDKLQLLISAKQKLFKEYLITICSPCQMYLVLKKLPTKTIKKKPIEDKDSLTFENYDNNEQQQHEQNYTKIVNNYNQKTTGYDKLKRLKNKIDVVINTNYMLDSKMYKNNRYITWYKTLSDTNKRDPADALHHALYAMIIQEEEEENN